MVGSEALSRACVIIRQTIKHKTAHNGAGIWQVLDHEGLAGHPGKLCLILRTLGCH